MFDVNGVLFLSRTCFCALSFSFVAAAKAKKSSLLSGNWPNENFFITYHLHSRMRIRIYPFSLKNHTHTHTNKMDEKMKKKKEKKEIKEEKLKENVILVVISICGKFNKIT